MIGYNYTVVVNTIPDPKNGEWWVGTTSSYVSSPDFVPVKVTFALVSSLSASTFPVTTTVSGLPTGVGFSVVIQTSAGSTTYPVLPGWTSTPVINLELKGSSTFQVNGSVAYLANGTAYYVGAVNVAFASMNSSGGATKPFSTLTVVGEAAIVLDYMPEYRVTVESTTGGSVTAPSNLWIPLGQLVTLTAAPAAGYLFTGWTGYGNGSLTKKTLSISPVVGGPITEIANFKPVPVPTYTLTVNAIGLPAGLTYTIELNGVSYSGNGTFAVTNLTAGSYTLGSNLVYSSPFPTTRWVPQTPITTSYGGSASGPITIATNGTATINFVVQYELAVSTTSGGNVTGTEAGPWYDSGAVVTLTANPNPGPPGVGYYFISWNGTGAAAVTGTDPVITVTMTSNATELAQFLLKPVTAPRLFILTIEETGLPTGCSGTPPSGALAVRPRTRR